MEQTGRVAAAPPAPCNHAFDTDCHLIGALGCQPTTFVDLGFY